MLSVKGGSEDSSYLETFPLIIADELLRVRIFTIFFQRWGQNLGTEEGNGWLSPWWSKKFGSLVCSIYSTAKWFHGKQFLAVKGTSHPCHKLQ